MYVYCKNGNTCRTSATSACTFRLVVTFSSLYFKVTGCFQHNHNIQRLSQQQIFKRMLGHVWRGMVKEAVKNGRRNDDILTQLRQHNLRISISRNALNIMRNKLCRKQWKFDNDDLVTVATGFSTDQPDISKTSICCC